jgi:tetratricopeptide (TPR) repeat protein
MPSLTPGQSLGPYNVIRRLGAGGMGEVWLATDARLNRPVALKTLLARDAADTFGRERLMREARAAGALTHAGIAAVHDVLDFQDHIVLVFEFVEGETLHARLRRGPLSVTDAVDVAIQMAEALDAAHRRGVIHRDLKPANVIITPEGRVKILDFGVARHVPADAVTTAAGEITGTRDIVGTPGYAAPEQWTTGRVDERADLFALGVMLFEMVAGRRPFAGHDALALATAMLSQEAPRLASATPGTPAGLDALVAHLLARSPDKRPASARQVLDALRSPTTTRSESGFGVHRRTGRLTLATGILLLVAVTGLVGWLRMKDPALTIQPDSPPVIAVLPLANLSGDAARDYVAAGVADSLITSLAALPGITVLSRASVADARARHSDTDALLKALGATLVVEGSVQQAGERLQVSLNLVRPDRSIAWGESFEGAFAQVFDLQARLARAVSAVLRVHVAGLSGARPADQPTRNASALEAYWRGRAYLERRDVSGNVELAVRAFEEAVQADPRFGVAYAALDEACWMMYVDSRDQVWVQRALDAGGTALRLDPYRPAVRYAVAITLDGTGRLSEAVDELQQALALQPSYDDARRLLGQVLARQGRIDAAVAEFQKAIAARPGFAGNYSALAIALYSASRYLEAAEAFEQVIQLQPDNAPAHQNLGAVYASLGQHDRALELYARALAIQPTPQAYSNMGAIYHLRGDFAQAVTVYTKALELRPNSHTTWRNLGDAHARLAERNASRRAYERAIAIATAELKVDPRDVGILSSLAVYLAKAGRAAEARSAAERALALAPADGTVRFRVAEVFALVGDTDEALAAVEEAARLGFSRSRIAEEEDFTALRALERFRKAVEPPAQGD